MKKPLQEQLKRIGGGHLLKEAAKHGFDLTDFKPKGYQKVLKALKIKPKAQLDRNESGWEWKGNGIMIVTGNNPITGEYAGGAVRRKNEKNYASYISSMFFN